MEKNEGVLLLHAVGGGDVGCPGARNVQDVVPDLEGDPNATGKARRPLRKIFEGLAAADMPVSLIALLGTTTPGAPGGGTFADRAEEMRARLTSEPGLCGRRFDPDAVHVIRLNGPSLSGTSTTIAAWLRARNPSDVVVSCGSGAYALSVGALCASIAAGRPATIVPIDTPSSPYALGATDDVATHLDTWLLRHRFWDALAERDPGNRLLWELLAARQAGDVYRVTAILDTPGTAEAIGLSREDVDALRKRWPITQAAMFERLGRGEIADHGLFRAWYFGELRSRKDREWSDLDQRTRQEVQNLLSHLKDRRAGQGDLSGLIRKAGREAWLAPESACATMLKDTELTDLYTIAATHRAHLETNRRPRGPLPPTLLQSADEWAGKHDLAVPLATRAGRAAWPVLGSGDVLGLLAVGLPREGRDAEDLQAIAAVATELRARRDQLPRRGTIRLRLLASPETRDRAHVLAHHAALETDADVRVIENVAGDIATVQRTLVAALAAEAEQTGGREVDEIAVFLNPGPPTTNHGMIAAAVDWSLTTACPLWVAELIRTPTTPEIRGGQRVLARLGADHLLADLAMTALTRLDVETAHRLIARGSDALRSAALPDLRKLKVGLFGHVSQDLARKRRHQLARQRLLLIAWAHKITPLIPAAYLAVESLRPAIYSWSTFTNLRKVNGALDTVAKLANTSIHSHALNRTATQPAPPIFVNEHLGRAAAELAPSAPDDNTLIRHYESIRTTLTTLRSP